MDLKNDKYKHPWEKGGENEGEEKWCNDKRIEILTYREFMQ